MKKSLEIGEYKISIKKIFLSVVIVLIPCIFFAEVNDALDGLHFSTEDWKYISFSNGRITVDCNAEQYGYIFYDGISNGTYDYSLTSENDLSFLTINTEKEVFRFLAVFNDDILILYDGDNREPFFFGYYGGLNRIEGVWRGSQIEKWFEASSWLTEGSYIYKPENMADLKTKEPWVEGVAGYGRGEKIIIKSYAKTLYILNGFYSYNMPWLWRQYSRIKKIRIAYLDNPEIEPFEVEIEDSPKLQKISGLYLNKFLGAESLEIEILEVYEGTHFDDTCINGIIVSAGE